ncbi:Hypp6776 [Branchiostoma lanceolatum]|uniref:Hypp6776 protein n=1 Tax=Branchiostoma lanceolatum TaxID=7740 RepID=A0A8J9YVD9_BRALA|nr:Hypp6776 [Branchiostoma lanceolatum]
MQRLRYEMATGNTTDGYFQPVTSVCDYLHREDHTASCPWRTYHKEVRVFDNAGMAHTAGGGGFRTDPGEVKTEDVNPGDGQKMAHLGPGEVSYGSSYNFSYNIRPSKRTTEWRARKRNAEVAAAGRGKRKEYSCRVCGLPVASEGHSQFRGQRYCPNAPGQTIYDVGQMIAVIGTANTTDPIPWFGRVVATKPLKVRWYDIDNDDSKYHVERDSDGKPLKDQEIAPKKVLTAVTFNADMSLPQDEHIRVFSMLPSKKEHVSANMGIHKTMAALSQRCFKEADGVMQQWMEGKFPDQASTSVTQYLFAELKGVAEEDAYNILFSFNQREIDQYEFKRRCQDAKVTQKENGCPRREEAEVRQRKEEELRERMEEELRLRKIGPDPFGTLELKTIVALLDDFRLSRNEVGKYLKAEFPQVKGVGNDPLELTFSNLRSFNSDLANSVQISYQSCVIIEGRPALIQPNLEAVLQAEEPTRPKPAQQDDQNDTEAYIDTFETILETTPQPQQPGSQLQQHHQQQPTPVTHYRRIAPKPTPAPPVPISHISPYPIFVPSFISPPATMSPGLIPLLPCTKRPHVLTDHKPGFGRGGLGWSRETLIAVTSNIESMEFRRKGNAAIGYEEHTRAGVVT